MKFKHVHSPEVIVVLDPKYDLSYKALYISTCSIALNNIRQPGASNVVSSEISNKLKAIADEGSNVKTSKSIQFVNE